MLEINKIYNIDCIQGIEMLPDNSVDLVVTSPPYDSIRDYKGFSLDLHRIGCEISRVLKNGGMCVMVIQDQTSNGRKSLTSFKTIVDWCLNTEMDLWECCLYQRGGTPGAWWNRRFRVDHEYIPIFIKGERPQYFSKEHMMIDAVTGGKTMTNWNRKTNGELTDKQTKIRNEKKCCGTILNYQSEKCKQNFGNSLKKKHPATFPDKLAEDFILAFTQEKMIVLDPFMGSGTVARMAKKNNRNYIGFDISEEYCELAETMLII
jgi:DNA modification methylase